MAIYQPGYRGGHQYPEGPMWMSAGADMISAITQGIEAYKDRKLQEEKMDRAEALELAQRDTDEQRYVSENFYRTGQDEEELRRYGIEQERIKEQGEAAEEDRAYKRLWDTKTFEADEKYRWAALNKSDGVGGSFHKMMGEYVMAESALQMANEPGQEGRLPQAQADRDALLQMVEMNIPDFREFESRFDMVADAATKAEADEMIQALIFEPRMSPEGKQYVQGVLERIAAMKPDTAPTTTDKEEDTVTSPGDAAMSQLPGALGTGARDIGEMFMLNTRLVNPMNQADILRQALTGGDLPEWLTRDLRQIWRSGPPDTTGGF